MADDTPQMGRYAIGGHLFALPSPPTPEQVQKLQAFAHQQETAQPGFEDRAKAVLADPNMGPARFLIPRAVQTPEGNSFALQMMPATGVPAAVARGALALAPYAIQNRGLPSAGEAGSVIAAEALPGLPKVPGMVRNMLRSPVTEALAGSQLTQDAARTAAKSIYQRPTERAGKLLLDARRVVLGAEPAMRDALKQTLTTWGIDVTKMNDKQLLALVREQPERAAAAFNALEKASGRKIASPTTIQGLWISDILHGSAKGVREGGRNAKGLLFEPGGALVLNGRAVADAWNKLSAEGQATFGNEGKRAFDGLVAEIDKLKSAPKGIRRLAVAGGDPGAIAMRPHMAAIERVMNALGPMGKAAIGAAGVYEAPTIIRAAVDNPAIALPIAAAGVYRIGKRAATKLFDRMLSTPAGVDWLTQGVRMQAQGLPTVMIADALSRSLIRATPILASLGLTSGPGGTNAAPTASPAQPGPGVGFSLPGGGS